MCIIKLAINKRSTVPDLIPPYKDLTLLPHPAGGEATSRVGPKIVLDHVCVYVYKNYVCALWVSSPLVVYDAIDNASSSRAHED